MNPNRILKLSEQIGPRERAAVEAVAKVGMASHEQVGRLVGFSPGNATPESTARSLRRLLARLCELELLARCERRVGGVRAGSAGYVYYLGPDGSALVSYWQGQGFTRGKRRPEPGIRHMAHSLSVTELYVQLVEATRNQGASLVEFEFEPECWRVYGESFGGETILKPDAFVCIASSEYEDRFFIEVDLGTESKATIERKLRAYIRYFETGEEQDRRRVFPRVMFIVESESRKEMLVDAAARLDADYWALFTITTTERAMSAFFTPVW
jgi:hypothetical protein